MAMIELTPGYSVSPQIALEDVQAAADAGITLVICNRPDAGRHGIGLTIPKLSSLSS